MLRFLADESCDYVVVRSLRAGGFEVLAVAEIAPGVDDEQVIQYAIDGELLLLTEDKDFGQLVYAAGYSTCGVILIRYTATARPTLGPRILTLVRDHGERLAGSFVVLTPERIRITALP